MNGELTVATNPLGSSEVVTHSDNSYAEAEVFYPFGGLRWRAGGTQDVRFAGMQERDGETSTWQDPLDPTPNRMYTSGLGRWLTPDPAGKGAVQLEDPQTWNMYAYVRNNPTTLTDASGLLLAQPSLVNALRSMLGATLANEAGRVEAFEELRAAGAATQAAPGTSISVSQGQNQEAVDKEAMTAEKAALKLTRAALKNGHRVEYGGWIIKSDKDGSLTFTKPVGGGEGSLDLSKVPVPEGFTKVAEYHTHPYTTHEEGEGASPGDVNRLRAVAHSEHVDRPGYVGNAFSGAVYRYTQWEPVKSWFDTRTLGTQIGTIPP